MLSPKPLQAVDSSNSRMLTFDLSCPILYELVFEATGAEWLTDEIREEHRIETE